MRLCLYDRTCVGKGLRPGLSDAWRTGAALYRGLARLDAAHGVTCWPEALDWLVAEAERTGQPIQEIQYWGHGRRGRVLIDREPLDRASLAGVHAARIAALKEHLGPAATIWFRTCETVGGAAGQAFASDLGERLGAHVVGHTYVIGFWQSGLHRLAPGAAPHWPVDEGVSPRGPAAVALDSSPLRPNTIHCLQNRVPPAW